MLRAVRLEKARSIQLDKVRLRPVPALPDLSRVRGRRAKAKPPTVRIAFEVQRRRAERLGALPFSLADFSVSSDGRHVAMFSYNDKNDVYMIRNFGKMLR